MGGFVVPKDTAIPVGAAWEPIDNTWEYDPAADTWKSLAPLPGKRGSALAAAVGGKIYVIGGATTADGAKDPFFTFFGPSKVLANNDVYDPATNKWESRTPMSVARNHAFGAAVNGKIYVRPHAQKTNAFQSNRNILLSDQATINTKPQLEIWADDVKCSHGCTSGQLDEEALFYLRSRGISKESAQALLLYAFAGEILDPMKDLKAACDKYGIKFGIYLSPWDRNATVYGDSPRYNDFYIEQLTELLTRYGSIAEVWFDGANGEGPNGRRQTYDWARIWGTVRRLQPNAVMFSDAGPDVRWIGNERGVAGDTNWSTVDPAVVPFPGASGDAVIEMLQHGDPSGSVWRPGETDVSIRPGWFHHAAEDARVKSGDDLVGLYFTSVGRNSKMLLNVPPTRDGQIHHVDVNRLTIMRARLETMFALDAAIGASVVWTSRGDRQATLELDLGSTKTIGIADLGEDVRQGQVVSRYVLEGERDGSWLPLSKGTTIGFRKLDRFDSVAVRRVRLTIADAVDTPRPVRIGLYAPS
jgi:alpha-L-fucosidase